MIIAHRPRFNFAGPRMIGPVLAAWKHGNIWLSVTCRWVKKGPTSIRNLPISGPEHAPKLRSRPGKSGNTLQTRARTARFRSVLPLLPGRERDFLGLRTGAKSCPVQMALGQNRENPRGARIFAVFAAKSRKMRDFRPISGPENWVHFLVSM